jgi:hypothetical protein
MCESLHAVQTSVLDAVYRLSFRQWTQSPSPEIFLIFELFLVTAALFIVAAFHLRCFCHYEHETPHVTRALSATAFSSPRRRDYASFVRTMTRCLST